MTFPSCSSKTTFFKDSGDLAIYCDRASRASSEYAGIFTLLSTEKPECLEVKLKPSHIDPSKGEVDEADGLPGYGLQ